MEWDDLDDEFWTIPAERNKSGRPHIVPLTPRMIELIQTIPRIHERLLFPAKRQDTKNHVSGFSKAKRRLDELSGVYDGNCLHHSEGNASCQGHPGPVASGDDIIGNMNESSPLRLAA